MDCNGFGVCGGFPDMCEIQCSEKKCPNLMWVEQYNQVMCWMVKNHLWEKYKFDTAEELQHLKQKELL